MRLPKSVVKELLGKNAPDARWSPEAIEAASLVVENILSQMGTAAHNNALSRGKRTVNEEDIAQPPSAPTQEPTQNTHNGHMRSDNVLAQNILRLEEAIRILTKHNIKIPQDIHPIRLGSPEK